MDAVDPRIASTQDGQRTERHLHRDERDEQQCRARELAALAKRRPDIRRRAQNAERDDEGAGAMREVDGDLRVPVVGNHVAEHPRKIRNRQPRARMPHRRAEEDLRIDKQCCRCSQHT